MKNYVKVAVDCILMCFSQTDYRYLVKQTSDDSQMVGGIRSETVCVLSESKRMCPKTILGNSNVLVLLDKEPKIPMRKTNQLSKPILSRVWAV